ncbi:T9SS type A sorting domain-containing protein [Dyadobacter luticola]|uniref:T9SS type A sorting domain-containing protein n=1 Tax=Dyadobacter luticola TaxID=1979387 RepID=A0A5R9KVM6_9BACT|nr:T9SS type A sorting domain-containing protein [Dyadobacter luticola]TLV00205.1 T9SS type A sorting domain-containing protein [Dyadobacter luticola]
MRYRIILPVVAKALLLICALSSTVFSQIPPIKITSPTFQAVYQRDVIGQREISVSGTFNVTMDKIEVRAVPVIQGQGIDTPWQTLQSAPKGGVFTGTIKLYGGWYTIEVRALLDGKIVGRDVLSRVGVGEVFIIAGQSNAQGLRAYPGPSAEDDRVLYISNYNNDTHDFLTDPVPPAFDKINSNLGIMSPRGQSAWCWGLLGDMLVRKLNVPVLFINTAWEGTAIENWSASARGETTKNKYGGFVYPPQMPYANLRIAARNYGNQYGVRAILWMQGEADALFKTPTAFYRDNLQYIMNRLGLETGGKRITWVIARTSRTSAGSDIASSINPAIVAAQNAVLETPFNPTYPGPETDPLVPDRGDGTHFVGKSTSDTEGTLAALKILANAWNETLGADFFSTVPPLSPAPVPTISANCVAENNAVTITLPTGYSSYEWSTGERSSTIRVSSAGTYRATVKDDAGNSILSSVVVLENDAKPVKPTIAQQGQQQACADSTFQFSVSDGSDIYSWYKEGSNTAIATGAAARIAESGNYYVKGQNVFGCISENSNSSSLIIREKISKPVIEASGPFSITAKIAETGLNEEYLWRRPDTETDTIADIIKILKSGVYSTKAKVEFNLNNNVLTCYSDTVAHEFKTNEENEVVIYPNPSQDTYVYIESRDNIKNAQITLFDIFGRVVSTSSTALLDSRLQINVGTLSTGKYIIRVTGEGQSLTKQIIIR